MKLDWKQEDRFNAIVGARVYKVIPNIGGKQYSATLIEMDGTGGTVPTLIGGPYDSIEQAKAACEEIATPV
jgi:hypothetical protein